DYYCLLSMGSGILFF
nr:immunoglobulin light chain junction region [Macaca mulatta]MOX71918.1 immunoglobulin light chain junction region [Macaca mulatta]MOX78808.1 immunoglobulin light chain junction region [Macaca mulatta]